MFKTSDVDHLRSQLDRFTIPMFVAEPCVDGTDFVIIALNDAYETQTGMLMKDVSGCPLKDLLPKKDARDVRQRYTRCISDTPQLRYRELLHLPGGGPTIWDTTLHHIVLPSGADRIVGGAVLIERLTRDEKDQLAFEDLRYFAANSSCTLSKIASVFDAFEKGHIDADHFAHSATVLAGLCRTVESTLEELRSLADDRLGASLDGELHLIREPPDNGVVDDVELAITSLLRIAAGLDVSEHGRPAQPAKSKEKPEDKGLN